MPLLRMIVMVIWFASNVCHACRGSACLVLCTQFVWLTSVCVAMSACRAGGMPGVGDASAAGNACRAGGVPGAGDASVAVREWKFAARLMLR